MFTFPNAPYTGPQNTPMGTDQDAGGSARERRGLSNRVIKNPKSGVTGIRDGGTRSEECPRNRGIGMVHSDQSSVHLLSRRGTATATARRFGRPLPQTASWRTRTSPSPAEPPQAHFVSRLNSIPAPVSRCRLLLAGIFRSRNSIPEHAGGGGLRSGSRSLRNRRSTSAKRHCCVATIGLPRSMAGRRPFIQMENIRSG